MNTGENEPEKIFTNWVDNLFACGRIGFSEMAIAKEMMYGWKEYLEVSGVGKDVPIWLTPEDKMADEESNEQPDDTISWWDSPISGLDETIIKRLADYGIVTGEDLYFAGYRLGMIFEEDADSLKVVKEYIENNAYS